MEWVVGGNECLLNMIVGGIVFVDIIGGRRLYVEEALTATCEPSQRQAHDAKKKYMSCFHNMLILYMLIYMFSERRLERDVESDGPCTRLRIDTVVDT